MSKPGHSSAIAIRPMTEADCVIVTTLLDATLGAGFWDLGEPRTSCRLVATSGGRIVGVGVGSVGAVPSGDLGLSSPVGVVRLICVEPSARGRGVATRLVEAICSECAQLGAAGFLAYAWVQSPTLQVPLGGVLRRRGFRCLRRVADFYAAASTVPCPACGRVPCVCSADIYIRQAPAP